VTAVLIVLGNRQARGVVKVPPRKVLRLLLDSSKSSQYNTYSNGRRDLHIFKTGGIDGLDEKAPWTQDDEQGLGYVAVLENSTVPLPGVHMKMLSLLHAVRIDVGDEGGVGYATFSRTLQGPSEEPPLGEGTPGGSEVLAGCNVIRPVSGGSWSEVTCVSHLVTGLVPKFVAKKMVLRGAANFIGKLREVLEEK